MPSIYSSHCVGCPYINGHHLQEATRSIRNHPLSLEDNGSKVLLIFQAPGIEEWKSGKPISSANSRSAGNKLRAAFEIIGKTRLAYNISNVVQCFPGKQKPKGNEKPRDKSPRKAVRTACSRWLQEDISKGGYERVVVFGKHAKEAVEKLDYAKDSRFAFVPHPTASGISIAMLAENVG